ncbi:hypothetical protein CFC21_098821 [Triticum aestivum]|uniref:NAC domain-containing protein n=3 Tax=Triticum aestivum TaxID=4565 RepID=A0A3B6RMG5_WHEAT|nr:hypothetical protein CFC21_098821 [Triticum aestivum]
MMKLSSLMSGRARTQIVVLRQLLVEFHPSHQGRRVPMAGAARKHDKGKMPKAAAVGDDWLNRHGFPHGYHFVPDDAELLRLLEDMIAGRALPHPLPSIFHGVRIRNYHPAELHELYKAHKEAGSIYFYNQREFSGSARVRPGRTAKDGWWKASGGGLPLVRRGLVVGYKLTLVFYEKRPGDKPDQKTDWIIKEYTIAGPNRKASEMALYRLYNKSENRSKEKKKKAKEEKATQEEENTFASTWAKEEEEEEEEAPPSPPYLLAGGTTSQAEAGQPRDYHHYYDLGAAPGPSTSCWVPPDAGYTGLTDTVWTPDAAGTSQAQTGQPHDYQQYTFGAAASAPGWDAPGPSSSSSSWVTPADTKFYLQLQHAGGPAYIWDDHKLTPLVPSGPAPPAHDLPASQQHSDHQEETAGPSKTQTPPPPPAPAAQGGYLDDEFDVWCKAQQVAASPAFHMPGGIDSQQVAASPAFDMPDGIDTQQVAASPAFDMPDGIDPQQVPVSPLPMLEDIDFAAFLKDIPMMPTDENNERLSCTLDELLFPRMEGDAPPPSPPTSMGNNNQV